MPSIPDAQLIHMEVVVSGNVSQTGVATKLIEFVFAYRRTTFTVVADKASFEAGFQTKVPAAVLPLLNAAYLQSANKVRWLDDATDAPLTVARAVAGAVVGDQQQNFDTLVFQFKTAYRGKSGRGSKHFAPLTAADTLGNILVAGTITAWNAIVPNMLTSFTDSTGNVWRPCIFSRKLSAIKANPTTVITNDLVAAILNKTTGTMRRRKVKTITA